MSTSKKRAYSDLASTADAQEFAPAVPRADKKSRYSLQSDGLFALNPQTPI